MREREYVYVYCGNCAEDACAAALFVCCPAYADMASQVHRYAVTQCVLCVCESLLHADAYAGCNPAASNSDTNTHKHT